jgi:hypothetical protein
MKKLSLLIAAAAMLAIPFVANADEYYNFGPKKKGLLLGVTKVGHTVEFRIQNTRKNDLTIVERMSCSGYGNFALESKSADNKRVRIALGNGADCKTDEKVTRTLESGRIAVITVDLPPGLDYDKLDANAIHGRARLEVVGRTKPVVLKTNPLAVETDSFP